MVMTENFTRRTESVAIRDQPADMVSKAMVWHVMASPGARWSQLRFRLFPQNADGDADSLGTFGRQVPVSLTAEESEPFRPTLADILAWWWRDPWHRLQAETRLSSLLVQFVGLFEILLTPVVGTLPASS